ncbi:unnamed protein product [Leptidea sinapis]|uniref:Uncharacterized protein n=1 Tax=Leptidea sinapis TaxID=189913 RepID=A0A5E4QA83_9NEOP|nr:unnamed protein product [Leptidea sinapis]
MKFRIRFSKTRSWEQHSLDTRRRTANPMNLKPKPAGTDDGFKGEGAACGNSVVKVGRAGSPSRLQRRTTRCLARGTSLLAAAVRLLHIAVRTR